MKHKQILAMFGDETELRISKNIKATKVVDQWSTVGLVFVRFNVRTKNEDGERWRLIITSKPSGFYVSVPDSDQDDGLNRKKQAEIESCIRRFVPMYVVIKDGVAWGVTKYRRDMPKAVSLMECCCIDALCRVPTSEDVKYALERQSLERARELERARRERDSDEFGPA